MLKTPEAGGTEAAPVLLHFYYCVIRGIDNRAGRHKEKGSLA
jgi:hypothetical protein